MLREHGEIGRQFPDVLANTTSAFGINDWEWLQSKEEVPFVTGIRKDAAAVFADLA